MTSVARTIGLLLLLPLSMILVRYAALPYSAAPGPISGNLLLYGGYLVLVAFVVSFVAIGYQLSKNGGTSVIQAGITCAVAFVLLQFLFSAAILKFAYGMSAPIIADSEALARAAVFVATAFGLGVAGFLWHSRFGIDKH